MEYCHYLYMIVLHMHIVLTIYLVSCNDYCTCIYIGLLILYNDMICILILVYLVGASG